jgi:hypothetical protein
VAGSRGGRGRDVEAGNAPLWDARSRFGPGWDGTGSLARNQNVAFTRICPFVRGSESLAKQLLLGFWIAKDGRGMAKISETAAISKETQC